VLWNKFKKLSLKEFDRIYQMLKVEFDSYAGESFYVDKINAVIDEITDKELLVECNGAKVVLLDKYNMPPCIIRKTDGANVYAARDLAAAIYRKKNYNFHKNIYVVGTSQALHFKQVFTTLKLMGHEWAEECVHVGFGLVKFLDKKLSTRKGDVIFLVELLNEAVEKVFEIMSDRDLEGKKEIAKKIGIGAVVFTYLKNNRERDIVFDWKEMLSFEGETGPYVQCTYARGSSVLRKALSIPESADYTKLRAKEEFELIELLDNFQKAILMSIDKNEPSVVTRYIIEVAKAFNRFYNSYSVLNVEDQELMNARIKMIEASCQVIKNGLNLLGIEAVEEM
jgi:arginyl-tRNA synthetase